MKIRVQSLVVLIIAIPFMAHAKDGRTIGDILKNIKKTSKKVDFKKSKVAIPQFKGATSTYRPKVIKPVGPSKLMNPDSEEGQLESINDQEIKQLVKLSNKYRRSKTRGEIWLRLAEAYVDKARNVEFRIQKDYDKKMKLYQKGKIKSRPRINLKPALAYNKEAIKLYEMFLKNFPKDEKVPQALFFLGYNYFELQQFKKGDAYYTRLVTKYKKSRYVSEAYFAKGEFEFENENWSKAIPHYQKVASNKRGRLYSFALYKLAWCYYKTSRVNKGLYYLEAVVRAGRKDKENNRKTIRLVDEARANFIPFYADGRDYRRAEAYFSRFFNSKEVDKMLERLAYAYVEMGKKKEARYTFKKLISKNPSNPKAYDYQYQIVTMYSTKDEVKEFRKELFEWVDGYGPNSHWAKRNAEKNPALVKKSIELVETTLRTYTLQAHQTAQNSRGNISRNLAKLGYEAYFREFKKNKHMGDMHFYYGELLYDMGDFKKAAENYLWVSENDPKGTYFEKSVLNAVLAIEKTLPSEKSIKKVVGKSDIPIKLDRNSALFERVALNYFKALPNSKNIVDIKYKLATLYYSYNQYEKAIPIYMDIVTKYPKSKYAPSSGHIVLDIYNTKENFVALEKTVDSILSIPVLARSKFGSEIKSIKEKSSFKRAQVSSDKPNDFVTIAEKNEKFAKENPNSDLRVGALFNAGVNYEKAGKLLAAIANYKLVLGSKSGNKVKSLKSQSNEFLAKLYEKTGQYKKSAEIFEKIAEQTKNPDYYYNAAVIRQGIQWYKAAIRNFNKYYSLSKSKDKVEVYFLIAEQERLRNRLTSAIKYYQKYINLNPSNALGVVEASFYIGRLSELKKNYSKRNIWYKKTINLERRLKKALKGAGVKYAAEAKFRLSYDLLRENKRIKIQGSQANQAKALKTKIALIDKLKNELATVIKYDDGYQIVASLTAIGQAYQHLSASIYGAPRPKGLNKSEMAQYLEGINKIVKPFKDKAIESYQAAIKKSYGFETYNAWVKVAYSELYQLENNKEYKEEFVVFPTHLADDLSSNQKLSKVNSTLINEMYEAWNKKDKQFEDKVAAVLSEDPNDILALNLLALDHFNRKNYGLAKILLSRILENNKKQSAALNNLGVINFTQGEMRTSIDQFRLSMRSDPDYVFGATNLSSIYVEYQDYRRALSPLKEGYRMVRGKIKDGNEMAIEVANNYAVALVNDKNYSKAEEVFSEIVEYNNRNITVFKNYAVLLLRYLKKKDKALDIFSKIKFLSTDSKILKEVEQLEGEAYGENN